MLHRLAWPSLLGALALVSACSSEEAPPPTPEPPPEMTLASFDAGLSVGAATAVDGRAAVMMDALADLKADVLCTQEIFRPADKSALETALGDAYPTKLSIANDPNDQEEDNPACGEDEANDAITCIETSGCEQMCVDDRDACIDMACASELGNISQSCSRCLLNGPSNVAGNEFTCKVSSIDYAYGGAFGLGLASRYDALATEEIVLESQGIRRGAIYAKLDTPFGPVHTFCTQLSEVTEDMDMNLVGEDQQRAQLDALLVFIEQAIAGTAGTGGMGAGGTSGAGGSGGEDDAPIILMGNLAFGPSSGNYEAHVANHYSRLINAGFGSPYQATPGNQCSLCQDNPLATDLPESRLVDHILIKGFRDASGTPDRLLVDPVDVETCSGAAQLPLSDHYAVQLKVEGK
ncbi:MAG: hypothetical protein KC731_30880 [Myxococcales bacterium]|nr:hypothetical protein [Myxococcales bacterium]